MGYADVLIDALISLVIFGALFPIINTTINGIGLDTINVSGTVRDFSWAGYLMMLGILFGAVYVAMGQIKKK